MSDKPARPSHGINRAIGVVKGRLKVLRENPELWPLESVVALQDVLAELRALSPEPSPDTGLVETFDRILQSAETMTRPMLIEWLRAERNSLTAHQEKG